MNTSFKGSTEHKTLMLGDCLDVLKQLPSECIDLTVTSPPYDNLRTYTGNVDWNFDVFKAIADELYRITKDGGVIVWIVADATLKGSETLSSFQQALYFKDIGLNVHDTMIYQKSGVTTPSKARYYQSFEYMFVLSKGKPKTFNAINDRKNKWRERWGKTRRKRLADGSFGDVQESRIAPEFGMRFNIWQYTQGYLRGTKDKIAYQHPATFPEALASDHILSWSNQMDLVLDPFMGSGTTGKMALLNNRKFIGIEKIPEYFQIAETRLQNIESTAE